MGGMIQEQSEPIRRPTSRTKLQINSRIVKVVDLCVCMAKAEIVGCTWWLAARPQAHARAHSHNLKCTFLLECARFFVRGIAMQSQMAAQGATNTMHVWQS